MNITEEMKDNAPEVDSGESYRLFLDISSTCTGYTIAKMEGRKVTISRAGVMWFDSKVDNGRKYFELQQAIGEFYSINAITDIIYEAYHVNPSQVGNSLVVPEMIGAVRAAAHDVWGMPLGTESISPTKWRGILGIKPIKTPKLNKQGVQLKTKSGRPQYDRDYKTPTINYLDIMFDNKIPKQLISNVTGSVRATPSDMYDSISICIAWSKQFGCDQFIIKEGAFDGYVEGVSPGFEG